MAIPSLDELIDHLWHAPADAPWVPKVEVIDGVQFREWVTSDDLEVLGFLFSTMDKSRIRIEPKLNAREYLDFVKRYTERCFKENPAGEWADSRYSAGWNLVGIVCWLWDNNSELSTMTEMKEWLADIYRDSDPDVRHCLETATLEHIFERKPIRKFFSDWKRDSILNVAYENASLWVKGGGHSPLSRNRKQ